MKKLSLLLIGLLFVPALFLTSCDQGEEVEETPRFTILRDYVVANGMDINKIITNEDGAKFVVPAPALADLNTFLDKYYIIDIRKADAFGANHIEGAKNIAFGDILTEGANAKTAGKPALVICYTGQTACYATALMRMYGYTNTQALKWGMSGWNDATASPWNGKIGSNPAQGDSNWTTSAAPTTPTFTETPFIALTSTSGSTLLKQRVEQAVADGFKTVVNTDVLTSPESYYINNFFSDAHYTGFGHIKGAYRINPITFGENTIHLDPSKKIVTYCYTGQTSAVITACLNVLGYDAYSLTFGMNGLYYDNSFWAGVSNHWGSKYVAGLPYAD
ncbi:Rhodanese-related sulfurtransferase [Lutibacter oricola]|uniref:Rhodanese-related sulfurtransferase n=1 Tax=Lutibacter oricola TaxID=762486 RepID=A0A1H3CF22_9FLAO|nr:rhodanese-like domain-containing protein [Lutibacter oricola]SDX52792.1 Rhodanese-related sulfurtransferase [Lutibacter oricola]